MAPNIGLEGLLPFVFMSLTTHIILSLRLPILVKDLFLLCAYTAIWTSRTRLHLAYLATTHRLQESLTILPEVAVEVARAFYDQTLASSFYALIWVLIWGPTTGLAILARFALGIAVFTCTLCYFTATTPLKALLWVPAWYCVVQPACSLLKGAAKGFISGVYHCVVSPRARSFSLTLAAAGLTGLRSVKAGGVICMRHRPRLSVLVRWVTAVGAACGSVGRAVLSDICQAASEGLALYRWTVATTGTLCCCAASRVYARILYTCCLPGHAAQCMARGVKKSVIFFRDEPGTVECLVVSIAQFCEEAKCTSDVLMMVPFAAFAQGKLIPSGSSRCARAFTANAIKVSRHLREDDMPNLGIDFRQRDLCGASSSRREPCKHFANLDVRRHSIYWRPHGSGHPRDRLPHTLRRRRISHSQPVRQHGDYAESLRPNSSTRRFGLV
ncbi:hypothetical protein C2E23DRAFT_808883 [Lenzites betulinus]|nr:hypothetical protein C2E23DRAFT_808883 [Lenzites betulinus]